MCNAAASLAQQSQDMLSSTKRASDPKDQLVPEWIAAGYVLTLAAELMTFNFVRYAYVYVYMYIYIYMCIYICPYMYTYIHMSVFMYIYNYKCLYICICICRCIQIYI